MHCAIFWAQVFTDWQVLFPVGWNIHFWRASLSGDLNPHGETMIGHLINKLLTSQTASIYCLPSGWIILNPAQWSFQMIPAPGTISWHTQLLWMTQARALGQDESTNGFMGQNNCGVFFCWKPLYFIVIYYAWLDSNNSTYCRFLGKVMIWIKFKRTVLLL